MQKSAISLACLLSISVCVAAACSSEETSVEGMASSGSSSSSAASGAGGDGGDGGAPGATSTTSATTGNTTVVGSGGGGVGGGGAGDGCDRCIELECSDAKGACAENPECAPFMRCADGCGVDKDCYARCFRAHEDGIADGFVNRGCLAGACGDECFVIGGEPLTACDECLFLECESRMNRCFANASCLVLSRCARDCAPGDDACVQSCVRAHPDGAADFDDAMECLVGECSDRCGL